MVLKDQHLVSWDLQEAKLLSDCLHGLFRPMASPPPTHCYFCISVASLLLVPFFIKIKLSQKKSNGDPGLRVAQNLPLNSLNLPRAQLLGDKHQLRRRYWAEQGLSVWEELYSLDPCVPKFYSPKETGHHEGQKKGKRRLHVITGKTLHSCQTQAAGGLLWGWWASFFGQCVNYNLSLNIFFSIVLEKLQPAI